MYESGDAVLGSIIVKEVDSVNDMTHLCRLCAKCCDSLIPIFHGEGVENDIPMKIKKYLPIEVTETDKLPLQLCLNCCHTLTTWHEFISCCIKADENLKTLKQKTSEHVKEAVCLEQSELKINEAVNTSNGDNMHESSVQQTVCGQNSEISETSREKDDGLIQEFPLSSRCNCIHMKDTIQNSSSKRSSSVKTEQSHSTHNQQICCKCTLKSNTGLPISFSTRHTEYECSCKGDCGVQTLTKSSEPKLTGKKSHKKSRVVVKKRIKSNSKACRPQEGTNFTAKEEKQGQLGKKNTRKREICSPQQQTVKISEDAALGNQGKMTGSGKQKTELFPCSNCSKIFTLKGNLQRHQRIHTDERPFTCHVCGKGFRDSGALCRHIRDVHTGVKNFTCDICSQQFASKATCDDHRRTHTGERPFVCAVCGKCLSTKASLYIHEKIHTDSFPYSCRYCEQHFRRRHQLLTHIMTHTGERPYICSICSRSFRVSGDLLRHMLVHSEERQYSCNICGMDFKQKRYLKDHYKTQHKQDEHLFWC